VTCHVSQSSAISADRTATGKGIKSLHRSVTHLWRAPP
jgi:hypothetical protein